MGSLANYAPLFSGAEQKYGLPPGTLGGIGYVESRYNPNAVSPKGAQGLMQFMPATARGMGLSNPFDPASSIDAAGSLMAQNLKATGGNLRNALMMYNAGANPAKWQASYPDAVLAHAPVTGNTDPSQGPYYNPQPGGRPVAQPASLASLTSPVSLDRSPLAAAPSSLGGLSGDAYGNNGLAGLAQGKIPQPSKFNVGNIAGILGDAMMAYGGMQPQFGPAMRERQLLQQQQDFEREKFNQELQLKMYQMLHPEEMMNALAFNNAPQPVREAMVNYQSTMHPTVVGVQQPNGSVINQVIPHKMQYQRGDTYTDPETGIHYVKINDGPDTAQSSWKVM